MPAMTESELALFDKHLQVSQVYVEFGSGGSTNLAAKSQNLKKAYCVEADLAWLNSLKKSSAVRENIANGKLVLIHADIGPTKEWSKPTGKSYNQWPSYYWGTWKQLPNNADFILIDGRFRVACALFSLCMVENHSQFRLAIHDYFDRPHYHIIEKYYDVTESADTLGIFRAKSSISRQNVLLDLYAHFFDFR